MIYLKGINLKKAREGVQSIMKSKSDTNSIAKIVFAFNGNCLDKTIDKWTETPMGQRYMNGERLCDLFPEGKNMPKKSLGYVHYEYLNYDKMDELKVRVPINKNLITKDKAFADWSVDCHDIMHILTGYGSDGLGELLRAEYEISQNYMQGWRLILTAFKLKMFFINPLMLYRIRHIIREPKIRAKNSNNFLFQNWFDLLEEDVDWIRARILMLAPTEHYEFQHPRFAPFIESHF